VTLKSNRWPGALVVAYNDKFANVYIGDGQKSLGNPAQNFIVPKLSEVQKEYAGAVVDDAPPSVEEITEQVDPTVDEEQAFEDSLKVKEKEGEDGEGDDEEVADGERANEDEEEDED
jgi:radial spoke head protein 4A